MMMTIALQISKCMSNMKTNDPPMKPLNILLDRSGNVKIGDLGVAKVLTTHLRAAHTGVGTPYYLSPEVAQRRPYNAKSDVWALGCILYECCTGRHPFTGNNQPQLFQQVMKKCQPPPLSAETFDAA